MATSALSQAIMDMYAATRPDITKTSGMFDGLVSDLVVGDYVIGARSKVTAVGTAGTTRSVTLERNGQIYTVTWVSAHTVRFIR
jgi:hypothetical protein